MGAFLIKILIVRGLIHLIFLLWAVPGAGPFLVIALVAAVAGALVWRRRARLSGGGIAPVRLGRPRRSAGAGQDNRSLRSW